MDKSGMKAKMEKLLIPALSGKSNHKMKTGGEPGSSHKNSKIRKKKGQKVKAQLTKSWRHSNN